jgi:hypothetical protein
MTFNRHAGTTQRVARKSPRRAAQLPATALSRSPAGICRDSRKAFLARSAPDIDQRIQHVTATKANKRHRPFQQDTVLSYTETARVLDRWLSQQDIDGDFTGPSVLCVGVLSG